jgi:glycosyltransferase involved in cell wall biosynthesis
MKVLWIGDGGCHTGFARVTHAIGDRLVERGHDVSCLATNFTGDHFDTKVKLYVPNSKVREDVYGKSRFVEMLAKVEPDVVVMLNDANIILDQLYDNPWDTEKILLRYRPILSYIPVDGHNRPPAWDLVSKISEPVAMSKFGQEQLPGSSLVYHGVDTDLFYPVSVKQPATTSTGVVVTSKKEAKQALGYSPDSFLVLRVDRNSGRKDYAASWKALVPVMKRHSDIIVHFHCKVNDSFGTELESVFARDPETQNRFFTPQFLSGSMGFAQPDLNVLYNAADLFISNSRGEGFGLTLAEALACEVPVIAQNISAIPEVVGPGGVLVDPERELTVPSGEDQWLSDIGAFSDAIEHLYTAGGVRRKLGQAGREHVVKSFSWDAAADRFHDFIEKLDAESRQRVSVAQGEDSHGN